MPDKKTLFVVAIAILSFLLGAFVSYETPESKSNESILQRKLNNTTTRLKKCQTELEDRKDEVEKLEEDFDYILNNYTDLMIDYEKCMNKSEK